jgi:hypothetical protein
MALIVSRQIQRKEFGTKIPVEAKEVLIRSARVALATPIAAKGLPPATRLLKAYATSSQGHRRIVYLLSVNDGTLFLLFYRDKDDPLGANITPKNPIFAAQLEKHLSLLQADIASGDFEDIDTRSS